MRFSMLLALILFYPHPLAIANGSDFSGAWLAWLCPSGVQYDPAACSNFVLELFQKKDKLCGSHVFATAGANRLDEGAAPSLNGTVANGIATVVVQSGRASPPIRMRVELKMREGGVLQWRRIDDPDGDYLLPLSAQLKKSPHKTLFSPVFEQNLSGACTSALNMAIENEAPPMTLPPP